MKYRILSQVQQSIQWIATMRKHIPTPVRRVGTTHPTGQPAAPGSGRVMPTALRGVACIVACLLPAAAHASFSGPLQLGFGSTFVGAAVCALPGALLGAVCELVGARRRPPLWVGILAGGVALGCVVLVRGVDVYNSREPVFLFPVPPLMSLALVTCVRPPLLRLQAAWSIAILSVWLGYVGLHGSFPGIMSDKRELLGVLLGGAMVSMGLWLWGFGVGQRALHAPPSGNVAGQATQ